MTRKSSISTHQPDNNGEAETDFLFGANAPADRPDHPTDRPADGAAADPAPDPFDPASLRLSQHFATAIGVKKALLTVPVRTPEKSWFVRVHPDPSYHLETAVIELKGERETYLVHPSLWPELATESTFSPRALFAAVNRQNVVFLWPVRLPGPDGRVDEWSRSALEAAQMATKGWVRVQANMSLGAYEVYQATGDIPDPEWPDVPFKDLLRIAFKDRLIDAMDHPVLRRLRGEI